MGGRPGCAPGDPEIPSDSLTSCMDGHLLMGGSLMGGVGTPLKGSYVSANA